MDMSGMDNSTFMDMGTGDCKISMLWNWYTVDTCFLSSTWHNNTMGKFAGSVIGVFLLVNAIEALRRLGRDYDRRIIMSKQIMLTRTQSETDTKVSSSSGWILPQLTKFNSNEQTVPTLVQQFFRSLIYGTQFTTAFLVILLGMYYNGYILLAIFLGQTTGYFFFGRDTCIASVGEQGCSSCC